MKNKHPVWTKLDWRGCRPLTLRELILKSNFDTMMDIIIDFDPKMSNQGGAFLRAVHCIRENGKLMTAKVQTSQTNMQRWLTKLMFLNA